MSSRMTRYLSIQTIISLLLTLISRHLPADGFYDSREKVTSLPEQTSTSSSSSFLLLNKLSLSSHALNIIGMKDLCCLQASIMAHIDNNETWYCLEFLSLIALKHDNGEWETGGGKASSARVDKLGLSNELFVKKNRSKISDWVIHLRFNRLSEMEVATDFSNKQDLFKQMHRSAITTWEQEREICLFKRVPANENMT